MKYNLLLLIAVVVLFPIKNSTAQVTNLKVDGSATSFTMTSGDTLTWTYDVPAGASTTIQVWYDVNGNGAIDPATDVLWQAFTQTDGDAVGNNGPPDMDGQVNGAVLLKMPIGLAPGKYVLKFTEGGASVSIAGTVSPLSSPAQTISGKVTVPSGKSAANIFVEIHRQQHYQPNFWDGVTDANGNYTIAMTADTAGNPWRADVVNNPYAPAVISPSDTGLTIVKNQNITGVNFSIVAIAAQVDGIVKDENGNPLVNMYVELSSTNSIQPVQYPANTDTSGIFKIGLLSQDLLSGWQWQLDASPRSGDTTATQLDGVGFITSISAGDSVFRKLVIYNVNSQIQGMLTIDGAAPGNRVKMIAMSQDTAQAIALCDAATGDFTLPVSNKISTYQIFAINLPAGQNSAAVTAQPGNTGIVVSVTTTGVKDQARTVPSGFALHQNYPNPFNPTTTITYDVSKTSYVTISVYNILGQKVANLLGGTRAPGVYSVNFDGSRLASGLYFYRMSAGNFTSTKKFVLLK
jgi:Secretion system C-terminal sorting domain